MDQEERNYKLITQGKDGEAVVTRITEEELGKLFFGEGNRKWDNVQAALPEPVWEKISLDGRLVYEGFTVDHIPFGAGRTYYRNGSVRLEGVFGIKGLVCGREYYTNGMIRFEGLFRINQAYGPNYPEYGIWYDEDGTMRYRGKFGVSRSSLGWPRVYEPEGFGRVPDSIVRDVRSFMWEDAIRLIRKSKEKEENPQTPGKGEDN